MIRYQQQQQFGKIIHVKIFCFVCFLSSQFDGEPGEMAKDACAEFCNHQKFALEQLKVSNRRSLFPAAQCLTVATPQLHIIEEVIPVQIEVLHTFLHIYFLIARIAEQPITLSDYNFAD